VAIPVSLFICPNGIFAGRKFIVFPKFSKSAQGSVLHIEGTYDNTAENLLIKQPTANNHVGGRYAVNGRDDDLINGLPALQRR
jgi:hypothetical protein